MRHGHIHEYTSRSTTMAWVEQHRGGYRVRYRLDDGTLITENGFTTRDDAEYRAADIESDQRRGRFVDPRLAQTSIDEWIRNWSQAHYVTATTRATYDSHIRNHILPRWSGTAVGDIARIAVKGWVNNQLRRTLSDKSCQDILVLFSMILGEAVDEGLIGTNPCRKLRITFTERPERPHATPGEVITISARMPTGAGLMVITAAYTGLRWGELAGLQWTRTYLDDACSRIDVDPSDGALHELGGRLELGPPKSAASARTVHLPPFLTDLLTAHRDRHPDTSFVFTGANGGLHRRATSANASGNPPSPATPRAACPRSSQRCTFTIYATPTRPGSSRTRCPACCGCNASGTSARTSTTSTPTSPRACGRRCSPRCSNGGTSVAVRVLLSHSIWGPMRREHFGPQRCSAGPAPHLLPAHADGLPMKIIGRPSDQAKHMVGDTGIEPVTSSV
jgi:integrase